MQVGAHHDVHVLGRDPGTGQCAEEVGVQVREERHVRPFLAVADARVDQDRPAAAAHQPRLHDGVHHVRLGRPELGDQPAPVGLPGLARDVREDEVAG